ncbi:MAG TPA: hypothetical protein VFV79_10285 [Saprospiraceae bacterium]|nr:hypothetical protein [Saprospiraceae bacterium]
MSINNIQLNSSLLADMYRTSLVDLGEAIQEATKTQTVPSKGITTRDTEHETKNSEAAGSRYLGEFKKNILILVRYNNVPHLPDEQLTFLTSILNACKLNLADVAILNTANTAVSHKDVQENLRSRFTILLGLTPEEFEMPVSFPEFQVQTFNNCTFLHTPVLEVLETDKVLKSKLWVCLRKMFGV